MRVFFGSSWKSFAILHDAVGILCHCYLFISSVFCVKLLANMLLAVVCACIENVHMSMTK